MKNQLGKHTKYTERFFVEIKRIIYFRYMMLIESQDRIYMLDRDNNVFQVNHLRFPKDSNCTQHLINTLVDGVCLYIFNHSSIYIFLIGICY